MPNLFAEASNNDALIRASYEEKIADIGDIRIISEFHDYVEKNGAISINMRPHVLRTLLTSGKYENIYQLCEKLSIISGKTSDEEMKRLLGPYYIKRISLDKALEIPKTAYYAALNIGGIGASKYGSLCIVLNGLASQKSDTIFIVKDSLRYYVDDSGSVKVSELISDACSSATVAKLCCIKHVDDPQLSEPLNWPVMACNNSVYVEALINHPITSSLVSEVRIEKKEYDALMDMALGGIFGDKRGDADRALAQDFVEILVKAKTLKIEIKPTEAP